MSVSKSVYKGIKEQQAADEARRKAEEEEARAEAKRLKEQARQDAIRQRRALGGQLDDGWAAGGAETENI